MILTNLNKNLRTEGGWGFGEGGTTAPYTNKMRQQMTKKLKAIANFNGSDVGQDAPFFSA